MIKLEDIHIGSLLSGLALPLDDILEKDLYQ